MDYIGSASYRDVWIILIETVHVSQRGFDTLEVPIMMAAPILFAPGRGNIGIIGPGDSAVAEFTLWSATRDLSF